MGAEFTLLATLLAGPAACHDGQGSEDCLSHAGNPLDQEGWFNNRTAHTGAVVTLIQRFGSALNLNIHFHILFLDGVYALDEHGIMRFHRVKAPTIGETQYLGASTQSSRRRFLEKRAGCNGC